jgi:hypothetical protein
VIIVPRRYRGGTLEERTLEVLSGLPYNEWVVPMQVGGSDASHHALTLARCVRIGLVDRKRRGGHSRPSWLYKINQNGIEMQRSLAATHRSRRAALPSAEVKS